MSVLSIPYESVALKISLQIISELVKAIHVVVIVIIWNSINNRSFISTLYTTYDIWIE